MLDPIKYQERERRQDELEEQAEMRERFAEASAETVLAELNDRLKSTLRGIAFDLGTIRGATQSDDHALRQVIRNARALG